MSRKKEILNANFTKQTTCESCLPVCLLRLRGKRFGRAEEQALLFEGLKAFRESYALGMCLAFVKKYKIPLDVLVGNSAYADELRHAIKNPLLRIRHANINKALLHSIAMPYILYIDNHVLGEYVHAPHFILVNGSHQKIFTIGDPWTGTIRQIRESIVLDGISSLRKRLYFCPLIICCQL